MADYAAIEVELKGIKYTTEGTDSTGLLFLSILFSEEETALIKQGRIEDVITMYGDRSTSRMKQKLESATTPEEKEKVEKQLNDEIMLALWQRMERDWEIRLLVAERIVELFRFAEPHAIPKKLVMFEAYKEGDKLKYEFGINLSSTDLLALFGAIVGPTLADISEKQKKSSEPASEPIAAIERVSVTEETPTSSALTLTDEHLRRDELTQQRIAIAKLLDSNPSDDMRLGLEKQLKDVDAQLVS
jgi:hypothetical protein